MKQYHDLLRYVIGYGDREHNRTGIDTLTVPGAMLKFDLRQGFPAITTKKLAFNQVKGELIGFLRGVTSAKDFRDLGCTVWDQNANENEAWLANPHRAGQDHLGPIYGQQWRNWLCSEFDEEGRVKGLDQIATALHTLRTDPESRRIVVSAWRPDEIQYMALPPCHVLFQLLPRSDGTLHMTMYQRSADLFLGVPFNIASYALLLELFAAWSGRTAATLTMFLADAHIYDTHVKQVEEQLSRTEYLAPGLWIHSNQFDPEAPLDVLLARLEPSSVDLEDYQCHPALPAPMAV